MPGMRMEMGQRLIQIQRLEQRLALNFVMDLTSEGGANALEQAELLKRFLKEVEQNVYKSPAEFHNRCMKRVRKSDRSESVKVLVKQLRSAIDALAPQETRQLEVLLQYGINTFEKRSWAPSVELEQISKLFGARQGIKNALFGSLQADMIGKEKSNYGSLLLQIGENQQIDDATFLQALGKLWKTNNKTIDSLESSLISALPEQVNPVKFNLALDALIEFEGLIPDFYQDGVERSVKAFVEKPDAQELVQQYSSIPLSLLAIISEFNPTEDELKKFASFCGEKRIANGRDAKRHIIIGAHQLALSLMRKQDVFKHVLKLATNAEQLEKVYTEIAAALIINPNRRISYYDTDATTFEQLYANLRGMRLQEGLGCIPLSPEYAEKLAEKYDSLPSKFFTILSKLGEIYKSQYPAGLPLLAKLAEQVIDGKFNDWKYSHEKADVQLLSAANASSWKENTYRACVLRAGDAVSQRLEALKVSGIEAAERYMQQFGKEPKQDCSDIQRELIGLEELLRQPASDKKALGLKARELRTRYELASIVELFNTTPDQIDISRRILNEKRSDKKFAMYQDLIQQAMSCFESPEIKSMETVHIDETDNYLSVLNVGVEPVQSCQRWTEPTGANQCLLAYVMDANKKVIYTRDRARNAIARTVLRLLPFKKKGLMFLIEPTYSSHWSQDHARALVSTVLQKAARLSEEIKETVRVGYSDRRSAEQYEAVFREFAEKGDVKFHSAKLDMDLPESINKFEYSDALGGCLSSGSHIEGHTLHYLAVGPEND